MCLCFNSPDDHPFISSAEKLYLQAEVTQLKRNRNHTATPWKQMLTSAPVLALIYTQAVHDWGFHIVASDLPKYLNDVLRISVQNIGFFSSIAFMAQLLVSFAGGFLSDLMISTKFLPTGAVRKAFVFLGAFKSKPVCYTHFHHECSFESFDDSGNILHGSILCGM